MFITEHFKQHSAQIKAFVIVFVHYISVYKYNTSPVKMQSRDPLSPRSADVQVKTLLVLIYNHPEGERDLKYSIHLIASMTY